MTAAELERERIRITGKAEDKVSRSGVPRTPAQLAWERAVKATFKVDRGWETAEDYWQWWLARDVPSPKKDSDELLFR